MPRKRRHRQERLPFDGLPPVPALAWAAELLDELCEVATPEQLAYAEHIDADVWKYAELEVRPPLPSQDELRARSERRAKGRARRRPRRETAP